MVKTSTSNIKSQEDYSLRLIKGGIWAYFLLLIFEGALRKWILPALAGPLVLIRDPLALVLLFMGFKHGYLKFNFYLATMTFVGILAMVTTLVMGHGDIGVCLLGARIVLLQFPLIFVIGNVFNEEDVIKMGKALLYISIPMTILMALQFYSPQSAWVNRGVGGDIEGAGFSGGAMGFFRPPGTFSFITGLTQFYGIQTCFVLYFWTNPSQMNRYVLIVASICAFLAIPFSISRTLLYQTILAILFFLFAVSLNPRNLPKVLFGTIGAVLVLVLLANISIFKTPIEAFTARFTGASKWEGGAVSGTLGDRYLGSMLNSIAGDSSSSLFGKGLGIATNSGAQLIPKAKGGGFWVEDEWPRIIYESGLILGLLTISVRVFLGFNLVFQSFKELFSSNMLPWLISSFPLLMLVNGQWGQPASLGFAIFSAGILMASLNRVNTD